MFTINNLLVTVFQQNCRVLVAEDGRAIVVDPGGESERIANWLSSRGFRCEQIWLSHSHLDHCGGVATLKKLTGASLLGHRSERDMRQNVRQFAEIWGVRSADFEDCPEPDQYLEGNEEIEAAGERFRTFHAPGHSPGSLCYYCPGEKLLLVGDVLFAGSIGRTDLPGGNHKQLLSSIHRLMEAIPGDTRVLCGHGPDTTLDAERKTNPFLQDEEL